MIRRVVIVLRFWNDFKRNIEIVQNFRFLLTIVQYFLTIIIVLSKLISFSDADNKNINCVTFNYDFVEKKDDDDLKTNNFTNSCTLNSFNFIVLKLIFFKIMILWIYELIKFMLYNTSWIHLHVLLVHDDRINTFIFYISLNAMIVNK